MPTTETTSVRNLALEQAWDFVEHTAKSLFLTGKAGTGKTTFLRKVVKESTKRMVVVAPTGVAAINAGGVTIHSFFQLPFSPFIPGTKIKSKYEFRKEKLDIIRTLDLLIIDEISMVRCDLLDAVDFTLRKLRNNQTSFGGVQLLLIGDLQQLTPVVATEEEHLLRQHYPTPYFFDAYSLRNVDYVTIELSHIYRQNDTRFVEILNRVRNGQVQMQDIEALNTRHIPDFQPPKDGGYIRLTTHNAKADRYNRQALEALKGNIQTYEATVEGNFPELSFPTDHTLQLKTGAQVMFVKNDTSLSRRYYNGRIGHITALNGDGVKVRCPGDDEDIEVEPEIWENTKYTLDENTREIVAEVQGRFIQLPLRLAWAITIHKSQGLTFDHAVIEADRSFAPGQVYVALSRCRTMEGMVLATPLTPYAIINDHRVDRYIALQEVAARQSIERLQQSKDEYLRQLLAECFTFVDMMQAAERMHKFILEHLRGKMPSLAQQYDKAFQTANKTIQGVAWKWTDRINRMSNEEITGNDNQQRIQKAIDYFAGQTEQLLIPFTGKLEKVTINNKETAKRFNDVCADFYTSVAAKLMTFDKIKDKPFTTELYLKSKHHSTLDAMSATRRRNYLRRKQKNIIITP